MEASEKSSETTLEDVAGSPLTMADARKRAMQDSSDSEVESPPRATATRTRKLEQTVETRLRQALKLYALSQDAMDCSENLSFLEEVSVGKDLDVAYKAEAKEFFKWARVSDLSRPTKSTGRSSRS